MAKKSIENIVKVLPQTLKVMTGYIKGNFDKAGEDALSGASGTAGIIIKLFGQDMIDNYFGKLTEEKLKDFGSNTYLKAALIQAGKSLDITSLPNESESLEALLIDTLQVDENTFTKDNILTIFTPQYHPIVVFIKEKMQKILYDLNVESATIKIFIRDFNENIESTMVDTFGNADYEKHKEQIKDFLFEEKESKLLWDMYQLNQIGFKESESLKYEETFASWKPVSSVLDKEENIEQKYLYSDRDKKHKEIEKKLKSIEVIIEEYFLDCTAQESCLKNILFTIADFGKGKSVFLKQYASKLAKEYTETKEGYFPIYFNLRNFANYSSEGTLGVLSSYLLDEYGIKIDDEEFQKKKYIFLVDSLDESGELTKLKIDKVILSIQNIQNINKEKYRNNRIIITSRPFSDGLESHLYSHSPYTIQNDNKEDIAQFISLYGFKEEQFNSWLYDTLKNDKSLNELSATGFAKEIIESIKINKHINIYKKLLDEKTLSRAELRRPIFSYMIYQLIINNVDFLEIGKIGVYLSFINLLTKEAKHIDDKSHKINQDEEIRYRNILHSISALWMYERQQGKQGILKKADICRVLDGTNKGESDREILERYHKEGVTEIQFLSHSYFGEEDNSLHFQHQSFAEILLAEYYLKVFIKYALDQKNELDIARNKLVLGEPTEQTILFFKELVKLLKETVSDDVTSTIIEKRKLLYPLFASLSTEKHNTLYSSDLYYTWFSKVKLDNNSSIIPNELLKNWAIDEQKLEKIVQFASEIINSKTTVLIAKTSTKNALFNNELTVIQNKFLSNFPTDIDRWLALVLGNLLKTDISNQIFFNKSLNIENLFEMIKGSNYSNNEPAPSWACKYFKGIEMNQDIPIRMQHLSMRNLDFSYSSLKNIELYHADICRVNFNNCIFSNVRFSNLDLRHATFDNIDIRRNVLDDMDNRGLDFGFSTLAQYVFMPYQLSDILRNLSQQINMSWVNYGTKKTFISEKAYYNKKRDELDNMFRTLKGLLLFGLKKDLFDKKGIKSWFEYENEKVRDKFETLIDTLEY